MSAPAAPADRNSSNRPRAFVITLSGPLGAGKTTLVRGLLRALGHSAVVRSPSYALMENYSVADLQVLHVDLYRLSDPEEIEGLGLRDFDSPDALWLVEWPQRAQNFLPMPDLQVRLSVHSDRHEIALEALSPRGLATLQHLRDFPASHAVTAISPSADAEIS